MQELELTPADKKRLRADVQLTSIIGLAFLLVVALLILVSGGLVVLAFDLEVAPGILRRGLLIFLLLSIPLIGISWKNFLRLFDIRWGKKMSIRTSAYRIEVKRDGAYLITSDGIRLKEPIYDGLVPLVRTSDPLTIEVSKLSKTLLFLSHDQNNLLDLVETQEKKGKD